LISFAGKCDPLALSRAAGNVELEDVLRLDDLLALALLAPALLGYDLAGSLTVATGYGFLGDEAGANLTEYCLCTCVVLATCDCL
jgi:hypothetical protein